MPAKTPPKKQTTGKISGKLWFSLISLGFVGSLAWAVENQFFNTFLYNKITPDPRPISWMVAASAITATLASILIGTLGDRLRYKYGRKPILLIGYIAWGITTAAFPLAALLQPISLAIAIAILFDCLMTFFGSGANDANFNAFATDVTTLNNRGKVLGVLQILTWVSMLFVYGASGLIIEAFDYEVYFFIIGALVFVLGIAGALLIKEEKPAGPPSGTYWSQIADTFQWKKLAGQRDLLLVLLGIMLWGIAQQIWFPYLMIYLSHYLKLSTIESTVLVAVAIGLGGIGMAYPFGLLVDRWGRKQVAILAVFLEMAGLMAFSFRTQLAGIDHRWHPVPGTHQRLDHRHQHLEQRPVPRGETWPVRRVRHPVLGGFHHDPRSAARQLAFNDLRHSDHHRRAAGLHPHPDHLPGRRDRHTGRSHPTLSCQEQRQAA